MAVDSRNTVLICVNFIWDSDSARSNKCKSNLTLSHSKLDILAAISSFGDEFTKDMTTVCSTEISRQAEMKQIRMKETN